MVYAYLQLAQDAKAKALVDHVAALPAPRVRRSSRTSPRVAAIPARYALERADWAGAAALPVVGDRPRHGRLARRASPAGLGMARSGDLAGAQREIQALQELRAALEKSSQSYWADRTEEQILAVAGLGGATRRARASRR